MEIINTFIDFIMNFINTIKELVASIRAENDKKD